MDVRGRVAALIELGAGFHPEISGRENIFVNGVMLGRTRREIARQFDEIVEFAELEDFIDAPVKTYSTGMYMRLGFSVAVHVDPDVLVVDEVLAVGDEAFGLKCLDKFSEFKRRGRTILLATHGLGMVERFCDEAVWMDAGRVRAQGDPRRVVHAYTTDVAEREEQAIAAKDRRVQAAAAERAAGIASDASPAGDGFPAGRAEPARATGPLRRTAPLRGTGPLRETGPPRETARPRARRAAGPRPPGRPPTATARAPGRMRRGGRSKRRGRCPTCSRPARDAGARDRCASSG